VQELGVLCNRSLYLADEVNSRLESQQDRLLQQDTEQLASLEAVVTICREIARSIHIQGLFDLKDARTVAKYALEIAKELKLPEHDCHILYHAAMLKDIGLLLSPGDMLELAVVDAAEKATSTKALFSKIWQALSTVPFLSPALLYVIYRYDKYSKKIDLPGVSGDSVPLGARILAIADAFHMLTSGRLTSDKLPPDLAVQKIVDQSGLVFNPNVVRAFLTVWKKGALN
jgi:response regulator RpfG family c-di-GMP phosphodiesterase